MGKFRRWKKKLNELTHITLSFTSSDTAPMTMTKMSCGAFGFRIM